MKSLLTAGNAKTGPDIFIWNLPPGATCPGATSLCRKHCYADKYITRFSIDYADFMKQSKASNFVDVMVEEIERSGAKVVRIHVAGDFYSAEYTRKWFQIAKRCPTVVFYCYTKSWRKPRIYPAANALRMLPNVELWWSCDSECIGEGVPEGRIAYMSVDDNDKPPKEYVDLLFRVNRHTIRKSLNGTRCCPKESGDPPENMTCQTCRLCFADALVK